MSCWYSESSPCTVASRRPSLRSASCTSWSASPAARSSILQQRGRGHAQTAHEMRPVQREVQRDVLALDSCTKMVGRCGVREQHAAVLARPSAVTLTARHRAGTAERYSDAWPGTREASQRLAPVQHALRQHVPLPAVRDELAPLGRLLGLEHLDQLVIHLLVAGRRLLLERGRRLRRAAPLPRGRRVCHRLAAVAAAAAVAASIVGDGSAGCARRSGRGWRSRAYTKG